MIKSDKFLEKETILSFNVFVKFHQIEVILETHGFILSLSQKKMKKKHMGLVSHASNSRKNISLGNHVTIIQTGMKGIGMKGMAACHRK